MQRNGILCTCTKYSNNVQDLWESMRDFFSLFAIFLCCCFVLVWHVCDRKTTISIYIRYVYVFVCMFTVNKKNVWIIFVRIFSTTSGWLLPLTIIHSSQTTWLKSTKDYRKIICDSFGDSGRTRSTACYFRVPLTGDCNTARYRIPVCSTLHERKRKYFHGEEY